MYIRYIYCLNVRANLKHRRMKAFLNSPIVIYWQAKYLIGTDWSIWRKKKEEIIAKCRNIDSLSAASGLSYLSTQDTRI